jgi:hypothetical protein
MYLHITIIIIMIRKLTFKICNSSFDSFMEKELANAFSGCGGLRAFPWHYGYAS